MKFDTEGTYTLQYTAVDECGNETIEDREVIVANPRTVLYTDGTFIINELPQDKAKNEALHGVATNVYAPFDPNSTSDTGLYHFNSSTLPWRNERNAILRVEVGQRIAPVLNTTDRKNGMGNWFANLQNCTSIDLSNIDLQNNPRLESLFIGCISLVTLNINGWDVQNVTSMNSMFQDCIAIEELDLSEFDTRSVVNTVNMFRNCGKLKTIYASDKFVTAQITSSATMFYSNNSLVGGAGTTYDMWDKPNDKTYARIDNPPSAPGYFTAKA